MCMTLILAPDISTPLRARHYCVSYSGTRSRTEVLVLWVLGTSVSCVAVSSVPMHNVQHQQQKKLQRSSTSSSSTSTSSSSRSTSCDVIIEHLDVMWRHHRALRRHHRAGRCRWRTMTSHCAVARCLWSRRQAVAAVTLLDAVSSRRHNISSDLCILSHHSAARRHDTARCYCTVMSDRSLSTRCV